MPLHCNHSTRLHNIRSCPTCVFAPRVPCPTPPFHSTNSPMRELSRQKKAKKCLGPATKPNRHVLSVTAKSIALTIIYMVGHHTNARFIQTATHLASPGVRPLSTNNAYHSPLPLEWGRGWGFCQFISKTFNIVSAIFVTNRQPRRKKSILARVCLGAKRS